MTILEAMTAGKTSLWRALGRTLTNPIVVGSVLGTLVSVSGIELPPVVLEPAQLIANACVPVLLISYGISLHGQRVLGSSGRRRDITLATVLKLVVMPLVAWTVAEFVFRMPPHDVLVVVVLAALPDRTERLQLFAAIRRRRDDLARHRLPHHDRLRPDPAAGDAPPRLRVARHAATQAGGRTAALQGDDPSRALG